MAELLKGAPVAAAINERTAENAAWLRRKGVVPTLAMVRVGENDGDVYYERGAMRRCAAVGVDVRNCIFPADVEQSVLLAAIEELNEDDAVHGILVFRPLPRSIDDEAVRAAIAPEKDVDGITELSLAAVFTGSGAGFCPCTAEACIEVLDYYGIDCTGRKATVIGRSLVIGKPAAMLLMKKNATVTVCHRKTADPAAEARVADILVVSAGEPHFAGEAFMRPGQVIIDVGINTDADGNLCGDVIGEDADRIAAAYTPVPGGVGAVTTSVLVKHTVEAAMRACRG